MVWGIIAALEAELAHILAVMDLDQTETAYGVDFHVGTVEGVPVVAVCSSIGTINAAVCTSTLIREFGAEAVVNIGVAGSTCGELSIFDVVLGGELVFHDSQTDFLTNYYPFRNSFPADPGLLRLAEHSISLMWERQFRHRVGRIATGDVFVSDPQMKEDIVRRCAPLCVEMEGAAVAQVAYMCAVPCLVIRCLSDDAAEGAKVSFQNFVDQASRNSADIVLGMLREHQKS